MNVLYNTTRLIFLILSEQYFNIRIVALKKLRLKKEEKEIFELLFEKNKFRVDRRIRKEKKREVLIQRISRIFAE